MIYIKCGGGEHQIQMKIKQIINCQIHFEYVCEYGSVMLIGLGFGLVPSHFRTILLLLIIICTYVYSNKYCLFHF